MIPKVFNKYTNYSAYILYAYQGVACKVDERTLCKLIQRLVKKYKKPYVRFMWRANTEDAMCALYDGVERKTKLITFNQLNTEE